jgi:hypothetical protein
MLFSLPLQRSSRNQPFDEHGPIGEDQAPGKQQLLMMGINRTGLFKASARILGQETSDVCNKCPPANVVFR